MCRTACFTVLGAALLASSAGAAVTITYTGSAPTYANTLTFDEPGGPTGSVAQNAFVSHGVAVLQDGAGGNPFVDVSGVSWLGTGNLLGGGFGTPWGAFMNLTSAQTAFSAQYWDNSGPATFSGGGAIVVALSNGAEVGSLFINNPTFGPTGPTWVNIVATGGSEFDEVRFVGFGRVFPSAWVDNISFVPAPSSLALVSFGGLIAARRRRA